MPNLLPNTLDVNIVRMYKALFDAAPGYTYLTAYRQLGDVQSVSAQLNAQFNSLSNAQWAGRIADGLHLTGQARTAAVDYLTILQNLSGNATNWRAQNLAGILLGYANNYESDPLFGSHALYFNDSVRTAFEYSINAANTTTDLAVLQLADEPNTPPVVVNDTASATEGGAIVAGTLAANDSDAQSDPLTYALAPTQAPVPGLTLNSNGGFLFDPSSSAYDSIRAGTTQQIVVNYRVSDGQGGVTPGTLTISVAGANDAPVALGATASGMEDAAAISVTPASTDVDTGDSATYAVATAPLNGTVVFNSGTGRFDYTPSANFNGTDSFVYRVTDGSGASSTAVATVFVAAVNDAPTANAASASGAEDTNIGGSVTGSDIEGTALAFAVASSPANGSVVLNSNGSFVYTPNANFNGTDSFTFTASDGLAVSAARTVTVTVTPVNDAPVALNVSATGAEDAAFITVAPASTDVDTGDTATYTINSQPANGTVSVVGGSFRYVPNANFNGTDAFTYRVTDGAGATSVATATVTVTAVNDAPVANNLAVSGNENTAILGSVTATDIDGDSLTYTVATTPANGTVSLNALTGEFTYTSTPGYVGGDSFTYTANDGNGGTSTATVTVTVNDVANILTTGVDNVALSGAGGQTVIGNHTTYNPGDSVVGSAGTDTVELSLTPANDPTDAGIVLGSANVNGVEIFRMNSNPVDPTDGVVVLMSNVGSALTRVELERSLGHNTTVADVQNIPLLELDDISGNVTFNIDNQVVLGTADAMSVDVKEFGTSSSSTWGRANLIIDGGIEILNVTDRTGSAGFPTDINAITSSGALNAGSSSLRTVNITGGVAGVPLTLFSTGGADAAPLAATAGGIITGVANTGVRINSTAFLGNLVADIDAARNSAGTGTEGALGTYTGVGADSLTAHEDVAGRVESGAGHDVVDLQADVSGTVMGGDGNDSIMVGDDLFSDGDGALIDGGAGDDEVDVGDDVFGGAEILGQAGDDDIDVDGDLSGTIRGGDGADMVNVDGTTSTGGLVEGNAGNDTLLFGGDLDGTALGGDGDDFINNDGELGDDGYIFNTGSIDGGAGNDTIITNDGMEPGSSIVGGDGNDAITVNGGNDIEGDRDGVSFEQSAAFISGGAGNDSITLNTSLDGDVDAGTGDDTVVASADLEEGTVALGDGNDLIELVNDADFEGDGDGGDTNDGAIDGGAGTDTMTLRSTVSATREMEVGSDGTPIVLPVDGTDISSIEALNIESFDNAEEIIDVEWDHTFDVNLQAFDTSLDTINVLERDDSSTVNLGGYDSEVINVDSDGDAGTDVTLNVSTGVYGAAEGVLLGAIHGLRDALETLTVNLNGSSAFEVAINDAAGINTTNLASNGSGARSAAIDGADQDNNGATAGEGNSLTITGSNTSRLTVTGIYQESVNGAAYAGGQTLTIANDDTAGTDGDAANDNEMLSITTGAGDDVVNILADILDLGDVGIDLGAGTDRLIMNESTRLLSLVDEDQVFQKVQRTEELELRGDDATNGATPLQISLEDDLADAGIRKVIVTNDGASRGMTDIDVDADILDSSPGRFTFEIASGDADIDDGADIDKTVQLWANRSADGAAATGSSVNFTQTGSAAVDVEVFISSTGGATTTISDTSLAGPRTADPTVVNNVRLDVVAGEIDSLTLRDSSAVDNGVVNLTYNDSWSDGGMLTVDASGILNNDFFIVVGIDGTDTGGLWFSGVQEDDTRLTVRGSQNDDTIRGSQLGDQIDGNDGDDAIWGDPALGSVIAPGTQMVKTLTFAADDVEAGDSYTVTVGARTYTWTAADDDDTVAMALASLAATINGDQAGVDGDADTDVAVTVSGLTMTVTGVDVDDIFGYALGENLTVSGAAINRPTAVVTVASEPYDTGDVVAISINGTPYSTGSTAGISTAASLEAGLIGAINGGGAPMTASAGSVVLRGNTASTAYTLGAAWTTDQLDVPATAKTVTVTYGGAPTSFSVTFGGGITISAASVAQLALDIDANGTVGGQWNASVVGSVLTLTAAATGAAAPANDFVSAGVAGAGSAAFTSVAGTDFIDRTDNTDPTIAARSISFDLTDAFYDEGDAVVVTINGTPYTATLPSVTLGDDDDHSAVVAAAAAAAALNGAGMPAGYVAAAIGSTVTVTAPDSVAYPTWAVSITDVVPVSAVAEVVTLDYTGFVAGTDYTVTANIGTAYTAATVGALVTAINAATGTHGYTAAAVGDVITLTSVNVPAADAGATGEEPAVDKGAITGTFTTNGGAVAAVVGTNALATPRTEVVDFTGMTAADGANITVNGVTYSSLDVGAATDTLGALVTQINAATGTHGFTAVVTDADTITLTGPADGSNPGTGASAANVLPDGGDITAAAATGGVAAVRGHWDVSAVGFDEGVDSVSVTFDTDGTAGLSLGDLTLSGFTWAALAAQINAAVGTSFTAATGVSGADTIGGGLRIYDQTDGGTGSQDPLAAGFAGTGGPATIGAYVAGVAATPWQQVVTVAEINVAGETATVTLTDGTVLSVPFNTDEATSLADIATALEAAIEADGKVGGGAIDVTLTASAVGNTITIDGPVDGSVPATTVSTTNTQHDILGAAVAGTVTPTAGVAADPYDVTLDFSGLGVGEVGIVKLVGGTQYTGATIAALVTAINAATGVHGWTASDASPSLVLTGPIDGTAPSIAFSSAVIVADNAAVDTEVSESWHNLDNTDPTLQVTSGAANTAPVAGGTAGVAAATAGANGADVINGGTGNDSLWGMGGSDVLNGGDGNDSLVGGDGADVIDGGEGADALFGEAGSDVLSGGNGDDVIIGLDGDDVISGGGGNDALTGGTGADAIDGGDGNDVLTGGTGRDVLTGGAGFDTFVFVAGDSSGPVQTALTTGITADKVVGFTSGQDEIDLTGVAGFHFVGTVSDTTNLIAALNAGGSAVGRTVYDSTAKLLYVDVNGDGVLTVGTDMMIEMDIVGANQLVATDFVGL